MIQFDYLLSFAISFAVCVALFTLTKVTKVEFSADRSKNRLTLVPSKALLVYLVVKIIQKSDQMSLMQKSETSLLRQLFALMAISLGSLTIFTQTFEWLVYLNLVWF